MNQRPWRAASGLCPVVLAVTFISAGLQLPRAVFRGIASLDGFSWAVCRGSDCAGHRCVGSSSTPSHSQRLVFTKPESVGHFGQQIKLCRFNICSTSDPNSQLHCPVGLPGKQTTLLVGIAAWPRYSQPLEGYVPVLDSIKQEAPPFFLLVIQVPPES